MNRLVTASVLIIVLVVAVAGALVVANGQRHTSPVAGSHPPPVPTDSTESTASPIPDAPRSTRGPAYDPAVVRAPTAQPPQSKLWFLAGRWWAVLANKDAQFSIHWLDWTSQEWHDTGTFVDERSSSRADVLVSDGKLYVASAGSKPTAAGDAIRVLRYSFDAATSRYILDDGFPVVVASGGAQYLTIARDGTGRLWLAYLGQDGLALRASDGDDLRWTADFRPSAPTGSLPAESAAIVAQPDRVIVFWTAAGDDAAYSATHEATSQPAAGWHVTRTQVDGLVNGPDQLDLKAAGAAGGPVFAALRTSLSERPEANSRDPQVLLLKLEDDGSWSQHVVSLVADRGNWPIVAIDEERGTVTVFTVSPGAGGRVYAKTASIVGLDFGAGIGIPFVSSDQDGQLNRPTSTKQTVSADTGLVVLASDDRSGRYVHGAVGLGGPAPGRGEHAAASGVPSVGASGTILFSDVFDAYPDGATVPNGWAVSDAGTGTLEVVAVPTETDHSARLTAASADVSASACRSVPTVPDGDLHVAAHVMVIGGPATDDAKLIAVRGRGLELASVRLNPDGTLAYFQGSQRQQIGSAFDRERWFAIDLTLHLAAGTYDWTVTDVASGTEVARASGAAWRTADRQPDHVCFGTATGPGSGLLFDDVRVAR